MIWSTVFFVVGFFGGNIDRIIKWIPTLKYKTPTIEPIEDLEEPIRKNGKN